MSFGYAKADCAKNPCHIRRVVLFELALGQNIVIDQPLQPEHANHVCLGFFQAAIGRPDRFPNVNLAGRSAGERRPESMRHLMHDRVQQVSFTGRFRRLRRKHQMLGHGQNYVIHPRIHEILEKYFLASP